MKSFDFAGNKRILEQLGFLIESGRFPHCLILEGEQGLGKKTLARQLAAALLCRDADSPCMACAQCRKVMAGIHPDVIEYPEPYRVKEVRSRVVSDAYLQPNEADNKIYILTNSHNMNMETQNALLKVMEEPPSYAIFILTCENKSAMLETVLSRSVVITLERVGIEEGARYAKEHFPDIDCDALRDALEISGGNIGKAVDLVGDGKASELSKTCAQLCNALVNESEYAMITACSVFQKDRQAIVSAMELMKNVFRDALVCGSGADMLSGQTEIITMLKNKLTRQKLIDLIGICDKLKEMALMNSNNSLLITKICYSLREAVGR